jgi:hypothetical protein
MAKLSRCRCCPSYRNHLYRRRDTLAAYTVSVPLLEHIPRLVCSLALDETGSQQAPHLLFQ